jgi:hypothetical protein
MSQLPRPLDSLPGPDLPRDLPPTPSFQEAIALTASALDDHAAGRLSLADLARLVASWVGQISGARGFFVAYLTGDWAIADDPPPEILTSIASAPSITAALLVKNVAMAAAMTLTHARQNHPEQVIQSQRTSDRAAQILLRLLQTHPHPSPTPSQPQQHPTQHPTQLLSSDRPFAHLAAQELQILQWQAAQALPSPPSNPPYPHSDRHGAYQTFLERWNYDSEQRSYIATVLAHLLTQAALPLS